MTRHLSLLRLEVVGGCLLVGEWLLVMGGCLFVVGWCTAGRTERTGAACGRQRRVGKPRGWLKGGSVSFENE